MKTIFKNMIPFVFGILLFSAIPFLNVSAASVSVSGGQYNVGASVPITIRFTADANLYAVEVDASYNSSVLRLNSVSGAEYTVSNGNIKIVDDDFSATSATRSASYTLHFTAIAAGNSNISASVLGGGESTSRASGSSTVTVVTPKPSSNANLSSIQVSGASLSPAFSPNTTSYKAVVDYPVESVNITASVADGGATYVGGGAMALNVGENSRTITVTAADNTKKSYTILVTRRSEEETAALREQERNANPFLVETEAGDFYISKDLSGVEIPTGFVQGTESRKGTEVPVIKDANEKYVLYWLATESGENGDFYTRDENDNFSRLLYVRSFNKLYIVEPIRSDETLPDGFIRDQYLAGETPIECFKYTVAELEDYYILYCYESGTTAYYRFDSAENTMQRAKDFEMLLKGNAPEVENQPTGIDRITSLVRKYHLYVIAALGVMLLGVTVAFICYAAAKSKDIGEQEEQGLLPVVSKKSEKKHPSRKHRGRRRKRKVE